MSGNSQQSLDFKWILIGFAIQAGLTWLLTAMLVEPVMIPMMKAMGTTAGPLAFVALVAFGAFFGGGLIVAYFSPGDTVKEPAISALLAITFNAVVNLTTTDAPFSGGVLIGLVITGAVAFAFAMLGAKVGEKLQGDTTDKMRERGDLRG